MPDPQSEMSRSLKEISHSLKTQNRILETLNQNIAALALRLPEQTKKYAETYPVCVMSSDGHCIVKEHDHSKD